MGYLEVIKGGKEQAKKVNVRGTSMIATRPAELHPFLRNSYERAKGSFSEMILEDQRCFDKREGWERFLELIPDKGGYIFLTLGRYPP